MDPKKYHQIFVNSLLPLPTPNFSSEAHSCAELYGKTQMMDYQTNKQTNPNCLTNNPNVLVFWISVLNLSSESEL